MVCDTAVLRVIPLDSSPTCCFAGPGVSNLSSPGWPTRPVPPSSLMLHGDSKAYSSLPGLQDVTEKSNIAQGYALAGLGSASVPCPL